MVKEFYIDLTKSLLFIVGILRLLIPALSQINTHYFAYFQHFSDDWTWSYKKGYCSVNQQFSIDSSLDWEGHPLGLYVNSLTVNRLEMGPDPTRPELTFDPQ